MQPGDHGYSGITVRTLPPLDCSGGFPARSTATRPSPRSESSRVISERTARHTRSGSESAAIPQAHAQGRQRRLRDLEKLDPGGAVDQGTERQRRDGDALVAVGR